MSKKDLIELKYCSKCKEILFVYDDVCNAIEVQARYLSPDGSYEYGEVDTVSNDCQTSECERGHSLTCIEISEEMLKKIYNQKDRTFPIDIPNEYYGEEISDDDFNVLLLEKGTAELNK